MLHFDKALTRLAANALRGRIRRNQFRVLSFDFLELLHEPVKLGIRNLRRVKHVIKVLMAADFIAQRLKLIKNVFGFGSHPIICKQ